MFVAVGTEASESALFKAINYSSSFHSSSPSYQLLFHQNERTLVTNVKEDPSLFVVTANYFHNKSVLEIRP